MAKHFRAFGGTLFTLGCGYASKWCADQSDVNNESVGGLWFYCASVFFGVWVLWGWVFVMACVWESGRDVPDAMSGRRCGAPGTGGVDRGVFGVLGEGKRICRNRGGRSV